MNIRTLREMCEITGATRKALQLYDSLGLLQPTEKCRTGRKEWLYDERALSKLQIIMLLKEADYNLSEINTALQGNEFDLITLYKEAIARLEKKSDRLQGGINYFKYTIEAVKVMEGVPGLENLELDESKLFTKVNWKDALEGSFTAFASIGEPDEEDDGVGYVGFQLLYLLGQFRDEGPKAKSVQSILRVIHGMANKDEEREILVEEYASMMLEAIEELKNDSEAVEVIREIVGDGFDGFLRQSLDYYVHNNGGELNA